MRKLSQNAPQQQATLQQVRPLRAQRFQQLQQKLLTQEVENKRAIKEAVEEKSRRKEEAYEKRMNFIDEGRKFAKECRPNCSDLGASWSHFRSFLMLKVRSETEPVF